MSDLQPILGGYHVKTTDDGRCIDIYRMLWNWRLTISPPKKDHEHCHFRGWCYYGHGEGRNMETAFLAASLAAQAWDGVGEPPGYDKQAF